MTCRKIQPELAAYLDDELTDAMADGVRQHVSRCPRCEQMLERLERVGRALEGWKAPELPPGWRDGLDRRIGGKRGAEGRMPIESRARFDASQDLTISREERGGLRDLLDDTPGGHESASRSLGGTLRWVWVIAATLLIAVGLRSFTRWARLPELPARVDTSGDLVPPGVDQIDDSREFVLALREEEALLVPAEAMAHDPDTFRILCLAFLRRALTAPVDWTDERAGLEVIEALLADPALARSGSGSDFGWLWSALLPGESAWADESPLPIRFPRDPRLAEGIALLGQGKPDEAAERFREAERDGLNLAWRASALAHQVRALASAGRFCESRGSLDRLARDYPSRRDLARLLEARLRRAERRAAELPALRGVMGGEPALSLAVWERGRAQVDAWQFSGAIATFEAMLAGPTPFSARPELASRVGLVLVQILQWFGRLADAREWSDRVAAEGVSPYREIAGVQGALLDSILGRPRVALDRLDTIRLGMEGDWWDRSRTLIAFMIGELALARGGAEEVETARRAWRAVLEGAGPDALIDHVRESMGPRLGEESIPSEEGSR